MEIYRQPPIENAQAQMVVVRMTEEEAQSLLGELDNTEEVEVECPGSTWANNWACECGCAGHPPNTMIFAEQETITALHTGLQKLICPQEEDHDQGTPSDLF